MALPYEVQSPKAIYRGHTYSSLVEDWFNWFISADADGRNSGPVVFLRSKTIPYSIEGAHSLEIAKDVSVSNTYADDAFYGRRYENMPNVRVGRDKLQICEDQAVFIPIIVAYQEASKPYIDWGFMKDLTGLAIDYGDNPPGNEQLSIEGQAIQFPGRLTMEDFRIQTAIFTGVVPEADYGRSVKDFLETNVPPGHYPVIADGYFVLLKFDAGEYTVHSYASAPRETHGPYFSELIYEIQVNKCDKKPSRGQPGFPGFRNERFNGIIRRLLADKVKTHELEEKHANKILGSVGLPEIVFFEEENGENKNAANKNAANKNAANKNAANKNAANKNNSKR